MLNFERHLKFYKKYFRNISPSDLNAVLNGSHESHNKKPGIVISFDDGLRSNFDYALPMLEKYSFTGWFFVPAGFVLNPFKEFAKINSITCIQEYPDGRYGFNQHELKALAENHVIGCHTYTHHRMKDDDNRKVLKHEISESKEVLESILQVPVNIFCWVGGEFEHYTTAAYSAIENAGYRFSFTTNTKVISKHTNRLNLNRTGIMSNNSLALVLFQLSGFMDLLYVRKRANVISKFKGL